MRSIKYTEYTRNAQQYATKYDGVLAIHSPRFLLLHFSYHTKRVSSKYVAPPYHDFEKKPLDDDTLLITCK